MTRELLADVLDEIGLLLELKNENPFKVRAGAGQIYSRSEDFLVLRIFFVALVYVNTYIRPV